MKPKILSIFFLTFLMVSCFFHASAQEKTDSLMPKKTDSGKVIAAKDSGRIKKSKTTSDSTVVVRKSTPVRAKVDTGVRIPVQAQTSVPEKSAGVISEKADSSIRDTAAPVNLSLINPGSSITQKLLMNNRYINVKDPATFFLETKIEIQGKEFLFYTLCIIVLILGIFKTFYSGYFNNLFRVYFNTSLRQTQLADQLVQAKLPSFILNIFFTITTGIYIWLLFKYYHPPRLISARSLLPFCILSVALLYFLKFCLLKFMGWVSDIQETTDNYIFAIFLVNKMIGIFLVPFLILLAFINLAFIPIVSIFSFLVLGLFFLSRYIKSYGVIERRMPMNSFHFLIYIIGAEIIPLLILYKIAVDYII